MTSRASSVRVQERSVQVAAVRRRMFSFMFLVLLGVFSATRSEGQYVQGEVTVGKNLTTPAPSQMVIDATQFPAADMCASIIAACQKLGTASYPLGATIDARGFTGDQVCQPNHATQMLNGCAANGGKLLLGTVHLYADGPTGGINGHYDDGHSSGAGTPAFIIPNKFWGIEGVSRGSGESAVGTFLSVCLGPNNPIGGTNPCHNSFPVRSFTVNAATVSTAGGVTTMTMTVSPH